MRERARPGEDAHTPSLPAGTRADDAPIPPIGNGDPRSAAGSTAGDSAPGTPGKRRRGLTGRVLRSTAWTGGTRLAARAIEVLRMVVLARLLTPYDFGLVGTASIVISWTSALSTTGSQLALIQHPNPSRALYDTAWTLGILRRTGTVALLALLAPWIAQLFRAPESVPVIYAMLLIPLVQSFRNIGMMEFRRELRQGPESLLEMGGLAVDLVVSIGLALWIGNAWALVVGAIAEQLVQTCLSYRRHPYRPRWCLDRSSVRELLRFGRWLFGSRVIEWLIADGVQAAVTRLLGVEILGHYRVSRNLARNSLDLIGRIAAQVTIPAFAKLQDDTGRLRRAYLRVLAALSLVTVPVTIAMAAYGAPVVQIALGPRWAVGGSLLPILAVAAFGGILIRHVSSYFRGTGRPERATFAALVRLGVIAVLIWPLARTLGATGVALSVAVAALVAATVALIDAGRRLGIGPRDVAPLLWGPVAAALPCIAVRTVLPSWHLTSPLWVGAALATSALAFGLAVLGLARAGLYPLDLAVPLALLDWLSRQARRLRPGGTGPAHSR